MINQVKVTFSVPEFEALLDLCGSELRCPADQVRMLVRLELQRRRLLIDQPDLAPQSIRELIALERR